MSAIKTVIATINGQQYTLNYNSAKGAYEASITAPTESSWNVNEGHYYPVAITATDVAGNSATVNDTDKTYGTSLRLRVKEKVKPTITFVSPTTGAGITNNKPLIKIKVLDEGSGVDLATFRLVVDSAAPITIANCTQQPVAGGYEISYTPQTALSDGNHTITANVSDNDGNTADTASISIKVDTVPPTLNVISPTDKSFTNKNTVTVAGQTNDVTSSPVTVKISVNGSDAGAVTVQSNGSFTKAVTLAEGVNTIIVTATDSLGKSTSVTRTVTLDTTAPKITEVSVAPNPVDCGKTYTITVKLT